MAKQIITFNSNNETLIWKSPITNIDSETQIIVPPTHEALFIKNGVLEEIYNQGKYYPIKSKGLFKKNEEVIAEIIYVNKSIECYINFGTPTRIDILDPFTNSLVKYGACGRYSIMIENTRKLYEKVLSSDNTLTLNAIRNYFADTIIYYVKSEIANIILEKSIGFHLIYAYLDEVSERIVNKMKHDYERAGLKLTSLTFTSVNVSDDDIKKAIERKKDIYCPACGVGLEAHDLFCYKCGFSIRKIKRCSACNSIINEEDCYCMNCGKGLGDNIYESKK